MSAKSICTVGVVAALAASSGAQAQVTELKARVKEAERAGDQREALRLMAVLHQLERPE